jgi:hypothetical protein
MMEIKGFPRSSGYARATDGYYVEPVSTTERLLAVEDFPGGVWDPCCGQGNVLVACRKHGIPAVGTDLVQRGPASQVLDFLEAGTALAPDLILNPPFDQAERFAIHALALTPGKICILQRTSWLESARRHRSLFEPGHLIRVWQFVDRISMPPGGRDVSAKNGSVSYAWFVFRREPAACTHLRWI